VCSTVYIGFEEAFLENPCAHLGSILKDVGEVIHLSVAPINALLVKTHGLVESLVRPPSARAPTGLGLAPLPPAGLPAVRPVEKGRRRMGLDQYVGSSWSGSGRGNA
jgi:hypothetical protein